ncbi:helix-turn-helix domain-containing protein [Flavihumibacter sp. UBA7668]|uniref:helix-turn-helix domain-containing protein n=1 Tax=Flavihumibacter sp. UBA7668 TaxID=1946542 RepID=UPI0025BDE059|nr:helix-turn-helix domain-containing protein [Flavihumibacter sp. UBA7668]
MKNDLLKEITPLTQSDCFTLFSRTKKEFDFPLHYHEEFELNFIENAAGARRIIGDHMEDIGDFELVLIGSNLQHGWFNNKCESTQIKEVTIQFHKDLLDDKFLRRNQLSFIRAMLEKSARGILFSQETARQLSDRLRLLNQKNGFDSVLELFSILHDLSTSRNMRILSDASFNNTEHFTYNSRRIEKAMDFLNGNFDKPVTLSELAKLVNMSDVAFSRFFKARTGNNFIDSLIDIRLGHATRMLIDTTHTIGEIAYRCGFNNMSNFNRVFKKKKNCTPKEFRENYNAVGTGTRIFI